MRSTGRPLLAGFSATDSNGGRQGSLDGPATLADADGPPVTRPLAPVRTANAFGNDDGEEGVVKLIAPES